MVIVAMNRLETIVAALLGALVAITATACAPASPEEHWTAAWAAAVQAPNAGQPWLGPNWSGPGFADQSVRQVVRVSAGGSAVRIRLSNRYGSAPLQIAGASVAKSAGGAAVRPDTVRPLTFGRQPFARIPAGEEVASDAAPLPIAPLEKLTVTLYLAAPTGPATFHEYGLTTTYRAAGDRLLDPGPAFAGETGHSWYFLAGVDTEGGDHAVTTVVAFGDSITDGAITTAGADNRYPDELAERLAGRGARYAVVNLGLNGNKVLNDSACYGEKGTTRFRRDVSGQPGAGTAIVLLGVNDILHPLYAAADPTCGPPREVTVEQLIEGHRQMIRAAHELGLTIIGATITPFKGAYGGVAYNEHTEGLRDALNQWIRSGREYDAVVDLDRALADPADPDALRPDLAAFDHLHPNDAGMAAIAAAIDAQIPPNT
jgi:lysophospholipase L1-like esterase